jgi:hypothetical protein
MFDVQVKTQMRLRPRHRQTTQTQTAHDVVNHGKAGEVACVHTKHFIYIEAINISSSGYIQAKKVASWYFG